MTMVATGTITYPLSWKLSLVKKCMTYGPSTARATHAIADMIGHSVGTAYKDYRFGATRIEVLHTLTEQELISVASVMAITAPRVITELLKSDREEDQALAAKIPTAIRAKALVHLAHTDPFGVIRLFSSEIPDALAALEMDIVPVFCAIIPAGQKYPVLIMRSDEQDGSKAHINIYRKLFKNEIATLAPGMDIYLPLSQVAIRWLADLKPIQQMAEGLKNIHPENRRLSVQVLGLIGDSSSLSALEEATTNDWDGAVRTAIYEAMTSIRARLETPPA